MSEKVLYRLKNSTAVEPLMNQWVAWSHLISPISYSLHIQSYQVPVLESYLKDPKVHVETCKDPRLRSGPFVDIPEARKEEVSRLLAAMRREQKANLELAQSLMEFHNYLVSEARGQSLEPFYNELPAALGGYVELVYDYYNRPTVRFFESLLYDSPYYNKALQSLRIFTEVRDDARAFFMSTPRPPQKGQLDWAVPFESPHVDELFKLDLCAKELGDIQAALGLNEEEVESLLPMLSTEPISPRPRWMNPDVRVRYFGHACALIEWDGTSVLTDPYLGVTPSEGGIDRFSYADLPEQLDYVVITHNHHDHFCIESLIRLRHRIKCLVVPRSCGLLYGDISLKLLAEKIGFRNVVELDSLGSIEIPNGEIIAVPFMGEHADLAHSKSAYVIRANHQQLLFAADSDCLDRRIYEHIRRLLGPIETVFIGMECVGAPLSWSCGPFLPMKPEFTIDQSRRYKGCDSARALEILEAIGAERVYIYAMGLEPWMEHLLGLALTDDSTQLIEARALLHQAIERGFTEARLLYGKADILLTGAGLSRGKAQLPFRDPEAETTPLAAGSVQQADNLEDQFVFE